MQNDIKSTTKKALFNQISRMIDFPEIDELMSQYVVFERSYIQNALVKEVLKDNAEFITLIKTKPSTTAETKEE